MFEHLTWSQPTHWVFSAEISAPCTIYKWTLRTADLVSGKLDIEQAPQIELQPGTFTVSLHGPGDLKLVALVRVGKSFSVLGFLPRSGVTPAHQPDGMGAYACDNELSGDGRKHGGGET